MSDARLLTDLAHLATELAEEPEIPEFAERFAIEPAIDEDVGSRMDSLVAAEEENGVEFCDCWPCARSVLQFLRSDVLKGGGLLKRVARWGLKQAIKYGDKYAERKDCPVPEAA